MKEGKKGQINLDVTSTVFLLHIQDRKKTGAGGKKNRAQAPRSIREWWRDRRKGRIKKKTANGRESFKERGKRGQWVRTRTGPTKKRGGKKKEEACKQSPWGGWPGRKKKNGGKTPSKKLWGDDTGNRLGESWKRRERGCGGSQ